MARRVKAMHGGIIDSGSQIQTRIIVGVPCTGLVRIEWVHGRYGQTIPVNWSAQEINSYFDTLSPLRFNVEDARNIIVDHAVRQNSDWLFFIDHDVVLPNDCMVKMNKYMKDGNIPVVSGLYAAKGAPAEPLVFRGLGNSYYAKWKRGDKVWADGIPMGCCLINMKLLRVMWQASEQYETMGQKVKRVFHTPQRAEFDLEKSTYKTMGGTEDIWWCQRVIKEKWLQKAGFKEAARRQYPFLVDTSIWCGHIDPDGRMFYPDGY